MSFLCKVTLTHAQTINVHTRPHSYSARDPSLEYYNQIKVLLSSRPDKQIGLEEIRNRLRLLDGFDEELLMKTVQQYETINVWTLIGSTLVLV